MVRAQRPLALPLPVKAACLAAVRQDRLPCSYPSAVAPLHDSSFEPISPHPLASPSGYESHGPIASGAFSMVLRAVKLDTHLTVAVKSFDAQRCSKYVDLLRAREAELEVLRALRQAAMDQAATADTLVAAGEERSEADEKVVSREQRAGGGTSDARSAAEAIAEARKGISHVHLANMLAELTGPAATHVILEYCSGGSLEYQLTRLRKRRKADSKHAGASRPAGQGNVLDGFSELGASPLLLQIASGLAHLHRLGIAHRDIKPSNLLFDDPSRTTMKICDFGFAVICGNRRLRDRVGTLLYKAPELCTHLPSVSGDVGYLGRPVDLWALGCVAFEMLHNTPAFRGDRAADVEMRIQSNFHTELSKSLSSSARQFIGGLLTLEASQRPTAAKTLGHAWLHAIASIRGEPLPLGDLEGDAGFCSDEDERPDDGEEADDEASPAVCAARATWASGSADAAGFTRVGDGARTGASAKFTAKLDALYGEETQTGAEEEFEA